jgi:hypothetical protein
MSLFLFLFKDLNRPLFGEVTIQIAGDGDVPEVGEHVPESGLESGAFCLGDFGDQVVELSSGVIGDASFVREADDSLAEGSQPGSHRSCIRLVRFTGVYHGRIRRLRDATAHWRGDQGQIIPGERVTVSYGSG